MIFVVIAIVTLIATFIVWTIIHGLCRLYIRLLVQDNPDHYVSTCYSCPFYSCCKQAKDIGIGSENNVDLSKNYKFSIKCFNDKTMPYYKIRLSYRGIITYINTKYYSIDECTEVINQLLAKRENYLHTKVKINEKYMDMQLDAAKFNNLLAKGPIQLDNQVEPKRRYRYID